MLFRTISLFVLLLPLLAIASSQSDKAREPDNAVSLRGANDDDDDDARRELLKLKCTTDPNLSEDSIWYTIEVDIFSITDLKCSPKQWEDIRKALEQELDKMDLFDQFKIIDLNPNLCDNPTRRQLLKSTDEDDPNDSQGIIQPSSAVRQRRLAAPVVVWYDLFYKGGSDCVFCIPDNSDSNSRLLLEGSLSNHTIATASAQNTMNNNNNDPIGDVQDVYDDVGFENAEVFFNEDVDDKDHHQDYMDVDDYEDTSTVMSNLTTTTTTGTDNDDATQTARALRRCGGCYRLHPSSAGNTRTIDKKTYIDRYAYWFSPFGVQMSADTNNNMCRTLARMVNVFDGANPGKSPNLGIPNQDCPKKGPGVGAGGKQRWSNGSFNPNRNCYNGAYNKVWTLQRWDRTQTEACNHGFHIKYEFRYPVILNTIALLDVHEENSVKVTVTLKNGKSEHFWAKNTGRNSLHYMGFRGIKGVKTVRIDFKKGGGKFSARFHSRVSLLLLVVVRLRFVSEEVERTSDVCSGRSLSFSLSLSLSLSLCLCVCIASCVCVYVRLFH